MALVFGVMQASLARAGVGRVEWLRDSPGVLALMIVSIPLAFLSNLGLIGICIWSFFSLEWLPTVGVLAVGFIAWSFIWGSLLAGLRRSSSWDSILALGIPLMLFSRGITALAVGFLMWMYVKGL